MQSIENAALNYVKQSKTETESRPKPSKSSSSRDVRLESAKKGRAKVARNSNTTSWGFWGASAPTASAKKKKPRSAEIKKDNNDFNSDDDRFASGLPPDDEKGNRVYNHGPLYGEMNSTRPDPVRGSSAIPGHRPQEKETVHSANRSKSDRDKARDKEERRNRSYKFPYLNDEEKAQYEAAYRRQMDEDEARRAAAEARRAASRKTEGGAGEPELPRAATSEDSSTDDEEAWYEAEYSRRMEEDEARRAAAKNRGAAERKREWIFKEPKPPHAATGEDARRAGIPMGYSMRN